ncbi:hypothetical protein ACLMJK_005794 [Lecanora helva]
MAITGFQCLAAIKETLEVYTTSVNATTNDTVGECFSLPSERRRSQSLNERPFDINGESPALREQVHRHPKTPETILYLAYGSNLAAETFRGRRGIRPLSAINVVVPDLVMTFDLPGLPYVEPCFANTAYRSSSDSSPSSFPTHGNSSEKSPLLSEDYHKLHWRKGLVGVVYEVTPSDFAHIIATEGGGASYQDVLVTCHPLPCGSTTVPSSPTTPPFKAHTLYSPITPPSTNPPPDGGRFSRPDPNYAQPSSRYIGLITAGADEHGLPEEYKSYLHDLRPYTITTQQQRLGSWILTSIFLPFISLVFGLNKRFADESGKAPKWLVKLSEAIFSGMWALYDGVFVKVFGDGERTIGEEGDDVNDRGSSVGAARVKKRRGTASSWIMDDAEKAVIKQQAV